MTSPSFPYHYFRYIHHTISEDEILMQINPGSSRMPTNPSHATLTIESQNPKTKAKEVTRLVIQFKKKFFPKFYLSY